jgi:hypothetical protein
MVDRRLLIDRAAGRVGGLGDAHCHRARAAPETGYKVGGACVPQRIHTRPVAGVPLIHVETPRYEGAKLFSSALSS